MTNMTGKMLPAGMLIAATVIFMMVLNAQSITSGDMTGTVTDRDAIWVRIASSEAGRSRAMTSIAPGCPLP
jgi:hypothetical protein